MGVEILLGVVQLEADEEALTLFRPAPERRCHVAGKDIARLEPRKIAVVAQGLCRHRHGCATSRWSTRRGRRPRHTRAWRSWACSVSSPSSWAPARSAAPSRENSPRLLERYEVGALRVPHLLE